MTLASDEQRRVRGGSWYAFVVVRALHKPTGLQSGGQDQAQVLTCLTHMKCTAMVGLIGLVGRAISTL